MSALLQTRTFVDAIAMSARANSELPGKSPSKIKKPRLRLPGHLAFQMPRGRQFEYAPEKLSKSRLGRAGLS